MEQGQGRGGNLRDIASLALLAAQTPVQQDTKGGVWGLVHTHRTNQPSHEVRSWQVARNACMLLLHKDCALSVGCLLLQGKADSLVVGARQHLLKSMSCLSCL